MTEAQAGLAPRPKRLALSGLTIAFVVVLADLATKHWAVVRLDDQPVSWFGGAVRLTQSRNSGAAFGMGTSLTPFLSAFALIVAVGLVIALLRVGSPQVAVLLGLFLGGVAGNLVDRLFRAPGPMRGHVVDWIDIGAWPNFNLADSSLVIAAVGVVWYSIVSERNSTHVR